MASLCLALPAAAAASARCSVHDPLRRPWFGDSHVHTRLSFDAWGQGTLAGPNDAYRFARGERIGMQPYDVAGRPQASIQLRRPLDWAVVTDHAELLGETRICQEPDLPGYDSLVCRIVRRWPGLGYGLVNGHVYATLEPSRYSFCGPDGASCREAARQPWEEIQAAAAAHLDTTDACTFTTFVGYEWTGMPEGRNLHRNVIFATDAVPDAPANYIETRTPEGLWRALDRDCRKGLPGCDVLAIPHNSNVSGGLMFRDDPAMDAAGARTRAQYEPLVEVTQHKGDSECRAGTSDPLCDYETLAFSIMQDMAMPGRAEPPPPGVYVRDALRLGLEVEARTGVNPLRLGIVGSTDTHLAAPGMVDEDAYRGHAAGLVNARFGVPPFPDLPFFNPGGLAVVWAEENARASLFAAMRRREVYGTSGPRMVVRSFAGALPADWCARSDFAAVGYARGVPMGGVLQTLPDAPPPRFGVRALRDPGGAGAPSTALQRIQIVKGWYDGAQTHERVFDVAGNANSDAGVDLATCTPQGAGFDQLCAVWVDPEWNAAHAAFYYARVVENPSCRWNQYVCNAHGVDCGEPGGAPEGLEACCDATIPRTIQERAWTSPIWTRVGP